MSRSRKIAWLKDELILCLDLYRKEGYSASTISMDELSQTLRSIPIESHLSEDPSFRSRASVARKLGNFAEFDPEVNTGLPNGGVQDRVIWEDFSGSPERLENTARSIRSNLSRTKRSLLEEVGFEVIEPEISEAPEGRVLTRVHRFRERNRKIVESKKKSVLELTGSLLCETCEFNFAETYGDLGEGFIECHHKVPVSQLDPGNKTKLADLSLLCSNCHRMIHRRAPWLSIEELRSRVREFRRIA